MVVWAIAWRNLWRNQRRTWLTASGIAFACVLLLFSRSMQLGSYRDQINATTALLTGHVQVQHPKYLDDPKLEYLVPGAAALAEQLLKLDGVAATTLRTSAFALLSVDERSFGAEVVGVRPEAELMVSTLPATITEGRYLEGGSEVVIGKLLATNLGALLGDELVLLGTGPEGGVAALALTIVGIFDTGYAALDRGLVQLPLETFHEGFYIDDAAGVVILQLEDAGDAERVTAAVTSQLPSDMVARPWQVLLPDVVQGIALDKISARLMYGIITFIVLFSIVNSFVITIFERTREFGMLLAIGMHPWSIIGMLQLEALWLALLGAVLGGLVSLPILTWLIFNGIPIAGMEEMTRGIVLPTHIKGAFVPLQLLAIPLVFVLGCQVASLMPGLRLLRVHPVEALRAE